MQFFQHRLGQRVCLQVSVGGVIPWSSIRGGGLSFARGRGFPVRTFVDVGLCSSPRDVCHWFSGFFYFLLSDGMSLTVSLKNVCFSQLHSISFI